MGQTYSVIIPVFNGEKFISRAIESVLAQTYPAHEIIVINDGSKDGTEGILAGFGRRIRFKTVPNGGVSSARNHGIRMASGDMIAFLDADDIWDKEKLAVHEELFAQFPNAKFSCSNYRVFDPYLRKEVEHFGALRKYPFRFEQPMFKEEVLKLLAALNFVGTASTAVIKREVLNTIGLFSTSYKQAEDYELWMRAATVTDFVITSRVLLEKKTHTTNLTNDQLEMNLYHKNVLIDFLKTHESFIREHQLKPDFVEAIARIHYKLGDLYFNSQQFRKSGSFYCQGFKSCKTPKNFMRLSVELVKKGVRLLSFGLISRKKS